MGREPPKIKVGLVGPPASGKTSLARRFVQNAYPHEYRADTMVDIGIKSIDIPEVTGMATVEVWAHPGEADVDIKARDLALADAWMLVVDASTPFLSECLDREFDEKVEPRLEALGAPTSVGNPLMVVVTHMDVVNSNPQLFVSVQQSALGWADAHGALAAFVSSATNDGVHRAFRDLVVRVQKVRDAREAEMVQPQRLFSSADAESRE